MENNQNTNSFEYAKLIIAQFFMWFVMLAISINEDFSGTNGKFNTVFFWNIIATIFAIYSLRISIKKSENKLSAKNIIFKSLLLITSLIQIVIFILNLFV